MVILTGIDGLEIRELKFIKVDVDLSDTKDFEIQIPASEWSSDLEYKGRVFIPGTEYGGRIGGKGASTQKDVRTIRGHTWRGMLDKKIIKPPAGEDYKIVSGELNAILKQLIQEAGMTALFTVSEENTGVSITSYQFDRYITLLSGIQKMLKTKGYRIDIQYVQGERGLPGYVQVGAVPVIDYSERIELSQDSQLNFKFDENKNGVNHLICLGKGDLKERLVVDLYIQRDGSVGTTQYFKGLDEVAETYENNSIDDVTEMTEKGTEEIIERASKQTFEMDVDRLGIEVEIGDIIGGRDYITGMHLAKPVVNKIYKQEQSVISKEYKLEGDEQ